LKILIVEDDLDLACSVIDYLSQSGLTLDHAFNAVQALKLLDEYSYDLIILDVILPKVNGFELCEKLRFNDKFTLPIIFLTAMDTLENKILGFNSGCDDYLVKPFDLPELECRIFALNKRGQSTNVNEIIFGELILYPLERKVYRNDNQIFLNKNQFNILMELIKQHPRAVTREKLIELIWEDDVPDTDSLRSHIYRLRNLIDKPYLFSMIETVNRIGFRIRDKNQ